MTKAAELAKMGEVLTNSQIGGRRNIVYNGAMTIWQRGTTADTASSGDYMCDRWRINFTGLDGNVDWDQETSSTPDGFGYALKISTDASESSLDAADNLKIQQRLEGQDLQQLKKGTSSAEKTTLSFWVKSSVASTYTMELVDNNNTRAISKSYTISSADTWEHKTIVFEGDTTGTLTTDNNTSMTWNIYIDAGSNFTSGTFSTSWQSTSDTERVFNTTGWLESTSPEFYITGVQWEVGSQATPFEHRSFAEEFTLCKRYFYSVLYRGGGYHSGNAASFCLQQGMRLTGSDVSSAVLTVGTNKNGAVVKDGGTRAGHSMSAVALSSATNTNNLVCSATMNITLDSGDAAIGGGINLDVAIDMEL